MRKKLHALCGLSGVIHSYDLSKASVADLHYVKDVKYTFLQYVNFINNKPIGRIEYALN